MPPRIAITTSLLVNDPARPDRAVLNAPYIRAIERAGGIPILVPPFLAEPATNALLDLVDGILVTGGGDVDPARYGEAPDPSVSGISDLRDTSEIFVSKSAIARQLPILLICRGMQVFNVALGGTLLQDIPISGPRHRQDQPRHETSHDVRLAPGSRLARILGDPSSIATNSMHHQALKSLAPGIIPTAWAEDGIIEAIEFPAYDPFLVGVQWHPEELAPHDPHATALFSAFITACT